MKTIKSKNIFVMPDKTKSISGSVLLEEFLKDFVNKFVTQAEKYIKITGEAAFAERERQVHSIIAPVLTLMAKAFMMEVPVDRNWRDGKSHGWIDYWCHYKNADFYIEVKHGYASVKTNYIRKGIRDDWQTAQRQLRAAQKDARAYSKSAKHLFLLGMHIIPLYEDKAKQNATAVNDRQVREIHRLYAEDLYPKPDWSACWILGDLSEKCKYDYDKKSSEYYHGVLFLAKAFDSR